MTNNTKNQNGFALVITLLLMVSISLIGLLALMNASTETMISRNEKEQKIAFQLAEAGLNEAYARLHISTSNGNYMGEPSADYTVTPRSNAWAGFNIKSNPTDANDRASISGGLSAAASSYTVTIRYLTENDTDNNSIYCKSACNDNEVVLFGQDFDFPSTMTPKPPSAGYLPVYKVTSTVTYGNTTITLWSNIAASSLNTDTNASINTNSTITENGSPVIENPKLPGQNNNITGPGTTYLGETIANLAAMADYQRTCTSQSDCNSIVTEFRDTNNGEPWGDWTSNTNSSFIYINNNSNQITISGNDLGSDNGGRGILIVTGNITFSGGFKWEGLIYVGGTATFGGGGSENINIQGGIMAANAVTVSGTSINIDYDKQTLQDVARESGGSAVVRWSRQ